MNGSLREGSGLEERFPHKPADETENSLSGKRRFSSFPAILPPCVFYAQDAYI
jgi:hypothetical protein